MYYVELLLVAVLASLLQPLWPVLWAKVKPLAARAVGAVPSKWQMVAAAYVVGLLMGGVLANGLPSINLPSWNVPSILAPSKVTAATYVYEKDAGTPPPGVLAGLSTLNAQGIIATTFEEDTTDGTGETPAQYKLAKEEATKAGLPALVIQAGDKVIRVIKAPATDSHVLEAIK